jgi:hypothetical protein
VELELVYPISRPGEWWENKAILQMHDGSGRNRVIDHRQELRQLE